MVYAITYDLKKPGQDYSALFNVIRTQGVAIHPLQNLWLLDSPKSADVIMNSLHASMDTNDFVFVCQFNVYAAWMPKDAHDWLESRT